jgi:hypothetical protein
LSPKKSSQGTELKEMPFDWLGAAQVGIGALGLFGQNEAQKQQAEYMRSAARFNDLRSGLFGDAAQIARNYDPAKEDRYAIDMAGDVAADKLGKSLKSLNQDFAVAGGSPTGDTAFRVRAQGAANRVADPLKIYAAQLASTETQRKAGMLGSVLGMGGDIADNYLKMASAYETNPQGAMSMMGAGFASMLGGGGGGGLGPATATGPSAMIQRNEGEGQQQTSHESYVGGKPRSQNT